jgi:hypothetical protein
MDLLEKERRKKENNHIGGIIGDEAVGGSVQADPVIFSRA